MFAEGQALSKGVTGQIFFEDTTITWTAGNELEGEMQETDHVEALTRGR